MEIKVLGTGCAGCKALFETVKQVLAETNSAATLVKEEDIIKIMGYNVMAMPALVIDEKVVSAGKKLSAADVKKLIGA